MLKQARVAVLVSGGGTNLQAILDAQSAGKLVSGAVKLVIANKADAYALTRAKNAGVKTAVILKKDCGSQEVFEARITELLEKEKIDLIVLAGFMAILSETFTKHFERRIINVHPSLIPSFCGAGFYGLRVHEAALSYGVKIAGATVHYVNHIPDGGEIILQKAVEILPGDTPELLQRRVMENAEWILLPRATELVAERLSKEKN